MTAEIIDFVSYRLERFAKKYAQIYVLEDPRHAQYYARTQMRPQEFEDAKPIIVREIKRLRRHVKKEDE